MSQSLCNWLVYFFSHKNSKNHKWNLDWKLYATLFFLVQKFQIFNLHFVFFKNNKKICNLDSYFFEFLAHLFTLYKLNYSFFFNARIIRYWLFIDFKFRKNYHNWFLITMQHRYTPILSADWHTICKIYFTPKSKRKTSHKNCRQAVSKHSKAYIHLINFENQFFPAILIIFMLNSFCDYILHVMEMKMEQLTVRISCNYKYFNNLLKKKHKNTFILVHTSFCIK